MSKGWEAVKESNNNIGEVEFLKTPQGVTTCRVIDEEPIALWKHWVQSANGGKGMSIVCSGDDCPICKANKKAKEEGLKAPYSTTRSFAINVIDSEGNVKILEKGKTLFESLCTLNEQMGDLINYEINITRTGTKMQDTKYTVLPHMPLTALTDEQKQEVLAKRINLEDYYKPLSNDDVITLMNGGTLQNNNNEENSETPDFTVE